MTQNTKFNAAILIIGNEILSGRTQDTNTSTIAQWLNSIGVKVNEVRVIPDIENTIIETVNHLRKVNNYVFTTGGIGPTHDDITAQSISKAFNLEYEIHKEAFKILEAYYKVGEFNEGRQKMAVFLERAPCQLQLLVEHIDFVRLLIQLPCHQVHCHHLVRQLRDLLLVCIKGGDVQLPEALEEVGVSGTKFAGHIF